MHICHLEISAIFAIIPQLQYMTIYFFIMKEKLINKFKNY